MACYRDPDDDCSVLRRPRAVQDGTVSGGGASSRISFCLSVDVRLGLGLRVRYRM